MKASTLAGYAAAGMFLANSLPHLIPGIAGNRHRSPLGRDSSAVVNVLWGAANLAGGYALLQRTNRAAGDQLDEQQRVLALAGSSLFAAVMLAATFSRDADSKRPATADHTA